MEIYIRKYVSGYRQNPDFENYTDACDALALVKKHKKFKDKKIDFIEFKPKNYVT